MLQQGASRHSKATRHPAAEWVRTLCQIKSHARRQWVTLCEKDIGQDLAQQASLSRAASLQTLLGSLSCQVQLLLSTQEQRQQAPQQACRQLACQASVLETSLQRPELHCPCHRVTGLHVALHICHVDLNLNQFGDVR